MLNYRSSTAPPVRPLCVLAGTQHLPRSPRQARPHDCPQSSLVGRLEHPGQRPLDRVTWLDCGQGLDSTDEGLALLYDAVDSFAVGQSLPTYAHQSRFGVPVLLGPDPTKPRLWRA